VLGFFRKRRTAASGTPGPRVPGGADSLAKRGAWLGIGHVKAARDALQSLTILCKTPLLTKRTQNSVRLELAIFCLSRSVALLGPLLAERFPELTKGALFHIQKTFSDSAWRSIGLFAEECLGSVDDPYVHCDDAEERSVLLWKRLVRYEMKVDLNAMGQDLARFEHRVLQATALFLLLDSLTVSEAQVAADHESFQKDTGLSPV
jgi:hypothetical protein